MDLKKSCLCQVQMYIDLQNTINDELRNVQKWLMQNKLTLNLNKTNYLLFHPVKEKQSHHFLLNLMVTC